MEIDFDEPIEVTLMPRVLGHGGFASGEIYISYLDRNYAGSNLDLVLNHEMVHILDARLGGELRPTLFVEGIAVYLTGGHFKTEPLLPRAAALLAPAQHESGLGLDWYLPLGPLADDFYMSQHEIGYLQAGALVQYMVETWGWEAFTNFYRDIHPHPDGKQSLAIDVALQAHLAINLAQLEERFLATLMEQEVTQALYDDVRLTVAFYDTVRRYQQAMDTSAYFLTAWLPNGGQMRELGIVADLVRHPSSVDNMALETLLVSADDQLEAGHYDQTEMSLDAVNLVLDNLETGSTAAFSSHPLADAHYQIVLTLLANGYQTQRIFVDGGTARTEVTTSSPAVVVIEMVDVGGGWAIVGNNQ
jgi:hypothetical protein